MTKKSSKKAANTRFPDDLDTLKSYAADVLALAKKMGASSCEVDIAEGFGLSANVRMGEIEAIEHNSDKGIGVTVYVGQKKGNASTSDFSAKARRETVEAALNIAKFTAEDNCAGLPTKSALASAKTLAKTPDLALYHPWHIETDEAILLAKRAEEAGFNVSKKITNSEGASFSSQESQFVFANSLGFIGGYPGSRHHLAASFIAGKGNKMQRDDWYSVSRNADRLLNPEEIGKIAATRAISRLNAKKIKTCVVPVIFEAPLATSLIGHFVGAASGGALYRESSFLLNSVGKRIFSKKVSIHETPFLVEGLASSPFDNEGVEVQARDIVSEGVLNGYFLSSYSARKLGLKTTGNCGGAHNLIVKSGRYNLAALLKKMGRGLLVTELLGQGVNYVNGDYSRGAAGFWVENGQIAHPVEEITIAGNLLEMYQNIVAIGSDVDQRGSKQTGSILIAKMNVAGS